MLWDARTAPEDSAKEKWPSPASGEGQVATSVMAFRVSRRN